MTYYGNRLTSVRDNAVHDAYNGSTDFYTDSKTKSYPLTYNDAGSLTSDAGRNIAYIKYDDNNNPAFIFFTDGSETEYVYSATGEKLRVIHITAKPNVVTRKVGEEVKVRLSGAYWINCETIDYLLGGALTLRNGRIDKYQFEEGYCQAKQYGNTDKDDFTFCYYDQDHLGNIRQVTEDDGSSKGKVIQAMNYYPFGAEFCDNSSKSYVQSHKYNGKEFDNMHGLNTYDYGARQYDPILARWDKIDPLCEKYYNVSPYNYCHNNPVMLVDPDGKDDYYDEQGHYLGRRDTGTDYIYIATSYGKEQNTMYVYTKTPLTKANISAEAWSNLLTKIAKDAGVDFSLVENSSISTVLVSKETKDDQFQTPYIDDEYGMPNYGVQDCYGGKKAAKTGGEFAQGEKARMTAFIWPVGSEMRDYYATVSNIQHLLYTHEYNGHYILGLADSYNFDQKLTESPLWHKTTEAYKKHVRDRMAKGVY